MILQMYLDGKLVDASTLAIRRLGDERERELYIQGAVNELLEKWGDLIQDQNVAPQFYIKSQFSF